MATGGGLDLDHVLPVEYDIPSAPSTSASILRKTQVRFLPNAQVEYSPNGSNIIEFTISSPTEQLILGESYFLFEIARNDTGSNDYQCSLDKGGIHSLFKNIQVRAAGANVQIRDQQQYNRFVSSTVPFSTSMFTIEKLRGVQGMGAYDEDSEERLPYLQRTLTPLATNLLRVGLENALLMLPAATTYQVRSYSYSNYAAAAAYIAGQYIHYECKTYRVTAAITTGNNTAFDKVSVEFIPDFPTHLLTWTSIAYVANDLVLHLGNLYVATGAATATQTPGDSGAPWTLVTAQDEVERLAPGSIVELQFDNSNTNFNVRKMLIPGLYIGNCASTQIINGTAVASTVDGTGSYTTVAAGADEVKQNGNISTLINALQNVVPKGNKLPVCQIRRLYARRVSNRKRMLDQNLRYERWLFKPNMHFFSLNLPLYLIKGGLTFRLELEKAELSFKTGLSPLESANIQMDYRIKNPRFVGMMSAPEPSVMRDTLARWNSAEGLIYYLPSVLYREAQQVVDTQNTVLNFHAGVRSARSILLLVQPDNISQSISAAICKACDSLSTSLRTNIYTWQIQIGAHLFPMERVDIGKTLVDAQYSNEALHRMMYMTQNPDYWIPFSEFEKETYMYSSDSDTSKDFKESKHFLIWVDLSRSNTPNAVLSGTDLSMVPLQMNIERSTKPSNYPGSNFIYRAFIFYDAFLRMSANMITTLQ